MILALAGAEDTSGDCEEDPIPTTLATMQLMVAAPKLLEAAKATLTAFELILEVNGSADFTQAELASEPLSTLRAAIADAESGE